MGSTVLQAEGKECTQTLQVPWEESKQAGGLARDETRTQARRGLVLEGLGAMIRSVDFIQTAIKTSYSLYTVYLRWLDETCFSCSLVLKKQNEIYKRQGNLCPFP